MQGDLCRDIVFGKCIFLCLRPDLCADLVPIQTDYEKPLLYHLPHLQLGSSDDVHPDAVYRQLLLGKLTVFVACSMDRMGALRDDVSGAILGADQHRIALLGMHR